MSKAKLHPHEIAAACGGPIAELVGNLDNLEWADERYIHDCIPVDHRIIRSDPTSLLRLMDISPLYPDVDRRYAYEDDVRDMISGSQWWLAKQLDVVAAMSSMSIPIKDEVFWHDMGQLACRIATSPGVNKADIAVYGLYAECSTVDTVFFVLSHREDSCNRIFPVMLDIGVWPRDSIVIISAAVRRLLPTADWYGSYRTILQDRETPLPWDMLFCRARL